MLQRVASIRQNAQPNEAVIVRGWVRTRRDSKKGFSFIEVNDGSCLKNIQIVVDADVDGYEDTIKRVTTGASVSIGGVVHESPGKGQRVEVPTADKKVVRIEGAVDVLHLDLEGEGEPRERLLFRVGGTSAST